jgi:hypothetical protein
MLVRGAVFSSNAFASVANKVRNSGGLLHSNISNRVMKKTKYHALRVRWQRRLVRIAQRMEMEETGWATHAQRSYT